MTTIKKKPRTRKPKEAMASQGVDPVEATQKAVALHDAQEVDPVRDPVLAALSKLTEAVQLIQDRQDHAEATAYEPPPPPRTMMDVKRELEEDIREPAYGQGDLSDKERKRLQLRPKRTIEGLKDTYDSVTVPEGYTPLASTGRQPGEGRADRENAWPTGPSPSQPAAVQEPIQVRMMVDIQARPNQVGPDHTCHYQVLLDQAYWDRLFSAGARHRSPGDPVVRLVSASVHPEDEGRIGS